VKLLETKRQNYNSLSNKEDNKELPVMTEKAMKAFFNNKKKQWHFLW